MNAWIWLLIALVVDLLIRILCNFGVWSPDILLITLIYLSMTRPVGEAFFMAFLSGLLWDTFFLDILGMHAMLFLLAVMGAAKLRSLIWGQYAVSRLLLGVFFSGTVRFAEVIFWLSMLDYEMPVSVPQRYIITGAVVTGLVFMLNPLQSRTVSGREIQEINVFGRGVAS